MSKKKNRNNENKSLARTQVFNTISGAVYAFVWRFDTAVPEIVQEIRKLGNYGAGTGGTAAYRAPGHPDMPEVTIHQCLVVKKIVAIIT